MPNHVTTILSFSGTEQAVSEVMDAIRPLDADSCEVIDFDRILPTPAPLQEVSAPAQFSCIELALALSKTHALRSNAERKIADRANADPQSAQEALQTAKTLVANLADYGHPTWYEWRNAKWGTKWNAYNSERVSDTEVRFCTAWNAPLPLLKALSEKFPDVGLSAAYADEDLFHNCGIADFAEGELKTDYRPDPCSREAMDVVFYVMPEYEGEYHWDDARQEIVPTEDGEDSED